MVLQIRSRKILWLLSRVFRRTLFVRLSGWSSFIGHPFCYSKGSERWNREIFEGADACFVCTDSSFGGVLIVASQCGKGLEFLLKPDFSKVNGDVFLGAMGQAFFSLSLGMGCLSTYASYFGKETKLGNTALSVGVIDTFVAVLAGLIIFRRPFL